MSFSSLLLHWRSDPDTAPNIPTWRTTPPRLADLRPLPSDLSPILAKALREQGIPSLYSHQAEAWTHVRNGENVVLATGTASGKTLAYNLPILAALLDDANSRAIYLYPTKALTQDQNNALGNLLITINKNTPGAASINKLQSAIYDGDTPQTYRSAIRQNSRIIFTNPDMLHTGILPHHTNWAEFFRNLKFVVIDEMHTYRGVFGSHVANVIRRLKRIAKFYGASPQFILTSATIGNSQELGEHLIELPVSVVDRDGSSRGERHFLIYNPPVIDEALGLRKNSIQESVRLSNDLLIHGVQSVVFARSRRSVEILLKYLQEKSAWDIKNHPLESTPMHSAIRGYRSGYLPSERREIEKGLRNGTVKIVVATNALELGIDIGGLGASILVGYPGTIASVYQQSGRAGRGDDPAVSVLVATANPLDQFLAHHPEYFFGRSPEQALVDPNHLLILLNHLRCAMFELPFETGAGYGNLSPEQLQEFLEFLATSNDAHLSQGKYYWMADAYPAASVSLRSASPENIILHTTDDGRPTTIGDVDMESALWMVHPRAVYLHQGQQYFVQELNLNTRAATLIPVALDYFTEPLKEVSITLLNGIAQQAVKGCDKSYGELQVTTQVTGFRKRMWFSGENLGQEPLELPPTDLQTTGYWIALSEGTIETLRAAGTWTNDPNNYGPEWPRIRDRVRARDDYRCQVCGAAEAGREHDVHHKVPFRQFLHSRNSETPGIPVLSQENLHSAMERANRLDNLVTLCRTCHRNAEANVRMRSGLAGLAFILGQLAPLFLMCDPGDLGIHFDPQAGFANGQPAVVLFDLVPAGIGFSQKLFEMHTDLVARALELVTECKCEDGCPSCIGPAGENGIGGKTETIAILKELIAN
jgi:DEAD/DEAH box helicase domain-containing protein